MFFVAKEESNFYAHRTTVYGSYKTKEEAKKAVIRAMDDFDDAFKQIAVLGRYKDYLRGENWISYITDLGDEIFVHYHIYENIAL